MVLVIKMDLIFKELINYFVCVGINIIKTLDLIKNILPMTKLFWLNLIKVSEIKI